jgi:hypothetical protein
MVQGRISVKEKRKGGDSIRAGGPVLMVTMVRSLFSACEKWTLSFVLHMEYPVVSTGVKPST